MNLLNRDNIIQLKEKHNLVLPSSEQLEYPEKVLQFGTGVLLRALPDFYIDEANRKGIFKGRVVMVKSTDTGSLSSFQKQDSVYTICMRGIDKGVQVDKTYVNTSISRALNATDDWEKIKSVARSPLLELIISNTTEVGIVFEKEMVLSACPKSFPGKILALLFERFQFFNGKTEKPLIILPTELIENNGDRLKEVLLTLSEYNGFAPGFYQWFEQSVHICNTLVDRIVPGKLNEVEQVQKEELLSLKDDLMISCEPFGLWAIESDKEDVRSLLSFAAPESGCVVVPSIHKFKELKLRMLNAGHSFTCALAILSEVDFVKQVMSDHIFSTYIRSLILEEIKDAIVGGEIADHEAMQFGLSVLDRFSNPFIEHKWESIAAQYPLKMKVRCIPLIIAYWQRFERLPKCMLIGLTGFLIWSGYEDHEIANQLSKKDFWGYDLSLVPGLTETVLAYANDIRNLGILPTISRLSGGHK